MDNAELRHRIVDTWKLVSIHYEDQATKKWTPVYGEHHTGRYRVENGQVITKVEAA